MKYYKRLCCGIFYLLKEKAKSDIPLFSSFMFTVFLFILVLHSVESVFYLLLKYKFKFDKSLVWCMCIIFAIFNYSFVFRNKLFLDLYDVRISNTSTIIVISGIFISSLTFVLLGGIRF